MALSGDYVVISHPPFVYYAPCSAVPDDHTLIGPLPAPRRRSRVARRALAIACIAAVGYAGVGLPALEPGISPGAPTGARAADDGSLRYLTSEPSTLDPAAANDAGTVQTLLQLYAGLTRLDEDVEPYPSLAEGWDVSPDGRTYRFTMRERLTFSDGSPLDATDVKRSWIRLLDPATGSPAAAMLADIEGASAFARGAASSDEVAIETPDARTLEVTLEHPASYFPAVLATPATFVVPRTADSSDAWATPRDFVGSGPYVVESVAPSEIMLRGNQRYVAGAPSIDEVSIVTDLTDTDPVTAFEDRHLDLTSIASWDAAWARYDRDLGASVHQGRSLSVAYFAFDTAEPPFDDARVRQAFALALDRPRLVALEAASGEEPASSLVPPALWPEGMGVDPPADPDAARGLLRDAGYADGADLGEVTVMLGGFGAPGVIASWEEELGVEIVQETMDGDTYFDRLEEDTPPIFTVSWVTDYPSPQALFGLLLRPEASSNYGRWDDARFLELLDEAASADDEAGQAAGYVAVDAYVDEQAPVIPYTYGEDWWLVRRGLRGARSLTIGIFDFGRLSWDE
ncbi:MAG: ABC transporter substrate-binding protein [Candidatus Limnocylindria bacterium]